MKLYREEQVRIAIDIALNGINQYYTPIINRIKPIELPNDEDILEECNKLPFEKHVDCGMYNDGQVDGFELGAKWMREHILGKEYKTFKQKSKWTEVDNMTRQLK